MISVTPIFFPSWVLVPQAVASMVSFLSRAKPAMLAKSSRLVKSRTLKTTFVRRDLVRMFPLLVAAPMAETVVRLAAHGTLAASSEDNYERYLYVNQKRLVPIWEAAFLAPIAIYRGAIAGQGALTSSTRMAGLPPV